MPVEWPPNCWLGTSVKIGDEAGAFAPAREPLAVVVGALPAEPLVTVSGVTAGDAEPNGDVESLDNIGSVTAEKILCSLDAADSS